MPEHKTRTPSKNRTESKGNVLKTGDRMKGAYLRTKRTEKNLTPSGEENTTSYAVNNTTEMGRELVHDATHATKSGVKKEVERGRTAAKKKAAKEKEKRSESLQDEIPEEKPETLEETPQPCNEKEPKKQKRQTNRPESSENPKSQEPQSREIRPAQDRLRQTESKKKKTVEANDAAKTTAPNAVEQSGAVPSRTTRPGVSSRTYSSRPTSSIHTAKPHYRSDVASSEVSKANPRAIARTGRATPREKPFANRTAGNRLRNKVQQEQGRKAVEMGRQKAISAAKSTRNVQKRIAAAIEDTKKAVASISAVAGGAGLVIVILMVTLFLVAAVATSGFGIFFSPDAAKQSPQKLPTVIRELNTDFQNKIENIEATIPHDEVEIYGARANWEDVLSIYAVKTTTDPQDGMEVATMDNKKKTILTNIFWSMNEISYTTKSEGYTVKVPIVDSEGRTTGEKEEVHYIIKLIITVAHKTAADAAESFRFNKNQKDELQELLAMDSSLWRAVLYGISDGSYGEYGEIVQVALSQVGNIGGQPYWSWYGFSSRVEWCACFVSWCADQCGYIEADWIPQYAWCPYGVQWFQGREQWLDGSMEPEPGMIIFYDWYKTSEGGQDGVADHTGIVERVENGIVYTVEGNWGDSVAQRELPVGQFEILGYGYMVSGD